MSERIEEIEARLSAATPGPWSRLDAQIRHTQIDGWVDPRGRAEAQAKTENDIQFVMNSPADVAYLLAKLRKAREALVRVEGQCVVAEEIATYVIGEDVQDALKMCVRHIRAAVADPAEPVTAHSPLGIAPDFTGGKSVDEYMDEQRTP